MANDIQLYESKGAVATTAELNYTIQAPNGATDVLVREIDFGVIPNTSKPSLFQSGAMKIKTLYGFFERHEIVDYHIPSPTDAEPYFCFMDKCELIKIHPTTGQEYVFQTSYAIASTREKNMGGKGAWEGAEACIQKAQKRALVKAVVSVSNLTSMFTMDLEDTKVAKDYKEMVGTLKEDSTITNEQAKRMYAVAKTAGRTAKQVKEMFLSLGYESTKDVLQKDYNDAVELCANRMTVEVFLKNKEQRDKDVKAKESNADPKKDS